MGFDRYGFGIVALSLPRSVAVVSDWIIRRAETVDWRWLHAHEWVPTQVHRSCLRRLGMSTTRERVEDVRRIA